MPSALFHWIATDAGEPTDGSSDAFVFLSEQDTGGVALWLVAQGHGPAHAPALAAAIVAHTVRDAFPESEYSNQQPLDALDLVLREASARLRAVAEAHPELRGMACSIATVVRAAGQTWVAHMGTCRVYGLRDNTLRKLTRDHVTADYAVHDEAAAARMRRDDVVERAIGQQGATLDRGRGTPIPDATIPLLLCTECVWRAVPEPLLEQALLRLPPRDACDAIVGLARSQWCEDDLTLAVLREGLPDAATLTSAETFVAWAQGEAVSGDGANQTLVIQSPLRGLSTEAPPSIMPVTIPRLATPHHTPPPPVAGLESTGSQRAGTQIFSPQVDAPRVVASDNAAVSAGVGGGTQVFAPSDLRRVTGARAAAPPRDRQPPTEGDAPTEREPPNATRALYVEPPRERRAARVDDGDPQARPAEAQAPQAPKPKIQARRDPFAERWDGGDSGARAAAHESFDEDALLDLQPGRRGLRWLLWLTIALASAGGGFAATLWWVGR